MADLLARFQGRVIVVIDACHSGQTEREQATNDQAVASLAAATAPMVVLAASKGRQFSEEMPGTGGGMFTQTFARLLGRDRRSADSNGDGVLEISEIYRRLKQAVVGATDGRQTPWLVRRNIVGDAPLF
jgi:Caspase domain